jgi:acetyl esterase
VPLDPQARVLLDQLAAAGRPPIWEATLADARLGWEALVALGTGGASAPVASVENRTIPGPNGEIPVRVYAAEGSGPRPALVWFHGGGFVIGSLDSYDSLCRDLVVGSGCSIVSVDYRLAPEHPFPAGVDDCYAATEWVAKNAGQLGIDPTRLAVGGDSAGGNLACVVTQMARANGGPDIAFQLLVYPGTDWDMDAPSMQENGSGYLLERESVRWFRDQYLTSADQEDDWRASPLRAESLAGLPPALVITAEFDPIRDYGERYAERLKDDDVAVTLHRYDGMIHGFVSVPGLLDAGRAAIAECAVALRSFSPSLAR